MNRFQIRPITLLALGVIAAPMVAQESTGQIVGTVKTKTGEVVVGAEVRLTSPALQGVRVVFTDAKGGFRAPLLPPGTYRVVVTKEGYMAPRRTAEVSLGSIIRQDIIVGKAAADAGAVVEVFATAAAVDKTDVKASTNITSEMMDVLPRSTRGMDTVALLSPGVTVNATAGGRVTMRGGTTTGNRFLLNGTDIADNVFNNTSGRSFYVDDSIAETQVIQSPVNARYGNFTGGIINAITKTGGNDFTGILRANFNRSSWSAQAPRGLRPGVAPTNAGVNAAEDLRNASYTLLVGGPIWKDHIWFSVSTKKQPEASTTASFSNPPTTTLNGNPAYLPATVGQPYTRISTIKFWEGKLTFSLNSNHTLEFTANKNESTQTNRDTGGAIEPDALYDSKGKNEYMTLGYRGILSSNLSLEARWARKQDSLGGGGSLARPYPQRISAAYSNGSYYAVNNGSFKDGADDKRNTDTLTANLTWFSPQTAIGTFTVDAGFELLGMTRSAPNDQSPTGWRMFLEGINADRTYNVTNWADDPDQWNTLELGFSDGGEAKTKTGAYYVNATLAVNDKLQVMVGGRYDNVSASDTMGVDNIKTSKFSPRFQVTYDLMGDQAWLFRGSYAVYVGALHSGFTNRFTLAGNPAREWYGWGGATYQGATGATYAQVTDINNWELSANGFQGVGGAASTFVDKNIKAPSTVEYSVDVKHAYKDGSYVKLAFVKRQFVDIYNDIRTIGYQVPYTPQAAPSIGQIFSVGTFWRTDDRLKRDYNSVEFEFDARLTSKVRFGGNYTYAVLKGNGESGDNAGLNLAAAGDPLGDFESVHAARGRDESYYAPYGYLNSDQRHRATMHVDYITQSKAGATFNASLLLNYRSGSNFSQTRTNVLEAQADAAAAGSTIVSAYPTTYTRFFGERGFGRQNDTFDCDLKLGVDVPIVSRVRYFLEVTVSNVFNHWQLAQVSTSTNATSASPVTNSATAGYYATPWNTSSTNRLGYGTYGHADYSGGRSVVLSTGIKW